MLRLSGGDRSDIGALFVNWGIAKIYVFGKVVIVRPISQVPAPKPPIR